MDKREEESYEKTAWYPSVYFGDKRLPVVFTEIEVNPNEFSQQAVIRFPQQYGLLREYLHSIDAEPEE